ncbi:histidine phosphatase family protein [Alloalcanivorax mobilis]|uniref:histidine phosphatase family protein n=1 Tax=Alloalcanivorax mobilis TaxID=2019569 RepID=UPI000B5B1C1B|nr:histidine phosphatase family protein [Alloalcanivorax mobilis]ASK35900.1 fructose-2,6-bisphosphatase [Alcanivorax sp. N3-2A]|tara:strand:- start:48911 stop:49585 length:675 start_codon:yes stop_codon:yes gene_type:complete
MAKLFVVRHGQASFGAEDYDALSDLGRQQARWLGDYFAERGIRFQRAMSGSLKRQRDTAREILYRTELGEPELQTEAGLNEYDGHALYRGFTGNSDIAAHQKRDAVDYWRTFRAAYQGWVTDELRGEHESWGEFGERIEQAVARLCEGATREDNLLLVTSGGVIGTAISGILRTDPLSAIELNFQFRNTAFCEIVIAGERRRLITFNALPHLDRPDRRQAITSV